MVSRPDAPTSLPILKTDPMDTIPTLDPEFAADLAVHAGCVSRRDAMRKTALLGTAIAASPFALATIARDAGAQTNADVQDALRFALTLEHLEYEFYVQGVDTAGLIPASDRALFTTIRDHEGDHVRFLQTALGLTPGVGPGSAGRPANGFDFTAGGKFDTFTNYQTYLAISQGLEDTGVRAYKGQAPRLINDDAVLEAALQIHSVEARHASAVRRVRGVKGWITGNQTNVPANQATYNGEENVVQGDVNLQTALGNTYSTAAITEAFDEPLTKDQVLAIAGAFIR